jgi:hypothetical protein
MIRRLRHTIAAVVLTAALLPGSAAATPADTTDTPAPTAEKIELLRMLNADAVETRERAVRLIGTYAHTGRYDTGFFRLLVTPLHGLVANGRTEAVRLMAVSALASIGTDHAIDGLRAQVRDLRPPRVQTTAKHAILKHESARRLSAVRTSGQ